MATYVLWQGAIEIRRKDHSQSVLVPDIIVRVYEDPVKSRHDPKNLSDALRYFNGDIDRNEKQWVIVKVYPHKRLGGV